MTRAARHHRRRRARCTAIRTLRSAALALAIVALPRVIQFTERGQFDAVALRELAQALAVAALMVLFNYVQRLAAGRRLKRGAARRRHRRRRHSAPAE